MTNAITDIDGLTLMFVSDSTAQYNWPPSDPSRLPNPAPPSESASAFVYGNEGFNPSLRPTNSSSSKTRLGGAKCNWDSDDENARSSPEPYLSDYDDGDDDGWGLADQDAEVRRRLNAHVREGSEGWEVRPASWGAELDDVGRRMARPWEDDGRYQIYESELPLDDGQDSDEWGDSPTHADEPIDDLKPVPAGE